MTWDKRIWPFRPKSVKICKKNINIIYNNKFNLLINLNLNLNIYNWVVNGQNVTNPKSCVLGVLSRF